MSIHSQVSILIAAIAACTLAAAPVAANPAANPATTSAAGLRPTAGPGAAAGTSTTAARTAVFRCAPAQGAAPLFSDEPCPGGTGAQPWQPQALAQGIARSSGPAGAPAQRTTPAATTARDDPFVDCRRRGGRLDLASRICHLPDDAARAMFKPE